MIKLSNTARINPSISFNLTLLTVSKKVKEKCKKKKNIPGKVALLAKLKQQKKLE